MIATRIERTEQGWQIERMVAGDYQYEELVGAERVLLSCPCCDALNELRTDRIPVGLVIDLAPGVDLVTDVGQSAYPAVFEEEDE